MVSIELFVQQQGTTTYSGYIQLDLQSSEKQPIKITKSIQDITDPQAVTSNYTRTFTVQNTINNGKFFRNAFSVNGLNFDPTKKCNAYILVNGSLFTNGSIRLVGISRIDSTSDIEYEIQYIGETGTFASVVGLKPLSQLNLSALTHDRTRLNVYASWYGALMDGNILYPLAEYGYTYDEVTKQPVDSTLSYYNISGAVGTLSQKGFTDSSNPLRIDQFVPFTRVKYIWDRIFTEAGFTYTSNFLGTVGSGGSDLWRKLYMVAQGNVGIDFAARMSAVIYGEKKAGIAFLTKIEATTVIKDPAKSYTASTSTYKASVAGSYRFRVSDMYAKVTYSSSAGAAPPKPTGKSLTVHLMVNGVSAASKTVYTDAVPPIKIGPGPSSTYYTYLYTDYPTFSTRTFDFAGISLNPGDKVTLWLGLESSKGFGYFEMLSGTWELVLPTLFDPTSTMPTQYKQIDFIKGINDRFKLMWTPDPLNPRNFLIEPWIDWINQGQKKDWTLKLDENSKIDITPLFSAQERQITFKDSEESDIYNFSYQQSVKQTFGTLINDSGIETISGNRDITSIFAPYPLAPIGGKNDFLIPHLAKDTDTERQPMEIKPRMCFYNGLVSAPYQWFEPGGSFIVYPLTSSFYPGLPFNSNSFDLNWNNSKQFWRLSDVGSGVGDGITSKTAYNVYWKKWFDYTYNPYSKIMEATFTLDYADVYGLSFNDKIWIKDSYWMPIKISDYVIGGGKVATKVQLVKYVEIATEPSTFILPPVTTPGPYTPASFAVVPTIAGGLVILDPGYNPNPDSSSPVMSPDITQQEDIYYQIPGLYYGPSECESCCETIFNGERTLYCSTPTMIVGSNVFESATGQIYAPPGWYKETGSPSNKSYEVNEFGIIVSEHDCSSCDCDITGLIEVMVAYSETLCGVCCSSDYTTIWHNGTTDLSTATEIYGDSLGTTPVNPGWYKENGSPVLNDTPVRVSEIDGITISQYGNCDMCDCGESPNRPLNDGIFSDYGTGNAGCCIENGNGINSFYQNDENFSDSTLFFFDPDMSTDPVGAPPVQVSDGEYWVNVNAGSIEGPAIACDYTTPCPGRTEDVNIVVNNTSGTTLQIYTEADITYDLQSYFYANSMTSLGDPFSDPMITKFAQNSYSRFILLSIQDPLANPPITNDCDGTFRFFRDGEEIFTERFRFPGTYISPDIQVGDSGTCQIIIELTPLTSP